MVGIIRTTLTAS